MRIKKLVKIVLHLPHEELLDGMNRRPSSSAHRALTWRRRTPTATAKRTMSAAGVRTASEKSRQLSASSPASSRASGGARVCERWRGGRRIFDRDVMGIYKERDSTTQLRRCPWWFTSEGYVASMQHLGSCYMFPRTPGLSGWSFRILRLSSKKDIALKTYINVCQIDFS